MHESSNKKRTARILGWVCGSLYPVFPALSLRDAGGFAGHGAAPFVERTDGVFSLVGGGDHHMAVVAVAKCLSPHDSLSAALPCALLFPFLSGAGLAHIHSPARGWEVQLSANWVWVIVSILVYVLVSWIALHYPDRKTGCRAFSRSCGSISCAWPCSFAWWAGWPTRTTCTTTG